MRPGRRGTGRGKSRGMAPGAYGIRTPLARRAQYSRGRKKCQNAVRDEPQDQASRILQAVCAVCAEGTGVRLLSVEL